MIFGFYYSRCQGLIIWYIGKATEMISTLSFYMNVHSILSVVFGSNTATMNTVFWFLVQTFSEEHMQESWQLKTVSLIFRPKSRGELRLIAAFSPSIVNGFVRKSFAPASKQILR